MSNTSFVQRAQLVCTYMFSLKGINLPVTVNSPFCLQSRQAKLHYGLSTSVSSEQLTTDSELSSFLLSTSHTYCFSIITSISIDFSFGAELAAFFLSSYPLKTFIVLEKNSSNHLKNCILMRITAYSSHETRLGSSSDESLSDPLTKKLTKFFCFSSVP